MNNPQIPPHASSSPALPSRPEETHPFFLPPSEAPASASPMDSAFPAADASLHGTQPRALADARLSLFASARTTTPQADLTVTDLVAMVRAPRPDVAARLAAARQALVEGDTERFAVMKRELPAVSIAGSFGTRNNKGLLAHSGLMPIDLDHLTPEALDAARDSLRHDPHCVFYYVSPSGRGLKGAIRIATAPADDAGHKLAFAAVQHHLRTVHQLELDPACKDVARLAFLSHDPQCFYNPHAEPLIVAPSTPSINSGPAASSGPAAAQPWTSDPRPETPSTGSGPAAQDSDTSYIPHQTSDITAASASAASEFSVFLNNDAGRAARFVDRWRDEIRYVTDRAVWLVWEGRWKIDRSGGIVRRAITLAYEIYAEAAAQSTPKARTPSKKPNETDPDAKAPSGSNGNEDPERQAVTMRQAAKWGNRRIIETNVELAAKHASIQCQTAHLDSDPWLLGTPNAIIDLRTGNAYSHRPEYLVTLATRAVFDHTATAPRWERFIEEIYPDPGLRRYVWKVLGYALTGLTSEKCFHFLTGVGNNGKSKLCEAIEYVAGDYAGHAAKGLLAANDKGQYPLREAASIVGKRILIGPETDARERLNVSVIKSLTGHGDTMRAANLYENQYDFIPVGKLFIMGNHKPTISDTGPAIWNRVRLIPHDVIFPPEKQDKTLGDKFRAEASGILNWLIEGCLLWQREGLEPPDKVRAAVEQYRTEEDTLGEFIDECIRHENGAITPHSEVYARYTDWARDAGIYRTVTKKTLSKMLREKGWTDRRTPQSFVNWVGVTLAE